MSKMWEVDPETRSKVRHSGRKCGHGEARQMSRSAIAAPRDTMIIDRMSY